MQHRRQIQSWFRNQYLLYFVSVLDEFLSQNGWSFEMSGAIWRIQNQKELGPKRCLSSKAFQDCFGIDFELILVAKRVFIGQRWLHTERRKGLRRNLPPLPVSLLLR